MYRTVDKKLLFPLIACSIFSVLLLYSIYINKILPNVGSSYYKTQLVASVMGIAVCVVLTFVDYSSIARLWFIYGPASVVLALLTFTPLGVSPGSGESGEWRRWIDIGITTIQPSEVLKLGFLLSFSYHLSKIKDCINRPVHVLLLLIHALLPAAIAILQNDYGTGLIFIVMFITMVFAAGISWKYILAGVLASPGIIWLTWTFLMTDMHRQRILVLFNPNSDPQGYEWQQMLGKNALSTGGLLGQGLLKGTDYVYVSELHNDFIFAHIGQTTGFVGCITVVILLGYVCIRIIAAGFTAKNELGRNICMGVFAILFTHFVLNIGMVLKVLPVIGIPLPFLSGGGTAMVCMYTAVGLVMSVCRASNA
ncbi:MAG: FtsW/RodA/SpoVE family cell cycle protein [Oscillospiraceae bacterium]|nr:FtsW/RodA/SpoVE family cell cycle protein [Oscillospiraceae bacterium]